MFSDGSKKSFKIELAQRSYSEDPKVLTSKLEDVSKIVDLMGLEKVLIEVEGLSELSKAIVTQAVEAFSLHSALDQSFKKETTEIKEIEYFINVEAEDEIAILKEEVESILSRCRGVITSRRLGNIPPNLLYPEKLAEEAAELAREHGYSCEVIDAAGLATLGMEAHLAVGAGSERPPCLIIIDTKPDSEEIPLALVGKGLTFDSGGISIKPSPDMHHMKVDMGGAAAVLGVIDILGRSSIEKRIIAVIGAAENMPDGKSYRPGDIVKTHKGINVEVLNTDAEGRMVLADALSYTAERFSPDLMIDMATLTGAMAVALGDKIIGMCGSDDILCEELIEVGLNCDEPVWQMPLMPHFYDQIKSDVADIKNIGSRYGGACTAAMFLKQFTHDIPWIHLDLTGAWGSKSFILPQEGASGMGVKVVSEFIRRKYR